MVPLEDLWKILEMPLIYCKVNLILTLSADYVMVYINIPNRNATISITETTVHVPVVVLSTQDNAELLPQLKSSFKRAINWN